MRKMRICLCFIAVFFSCSFVFCQAWDPKPNVLYLSIGKEAFYSNTKQQGWEGNTVASSGYQVASINYNMEVKVFSNDGYFIFYLPQKAASYSIIRGYLQVANYSQKDNKITLLGRISLTDDKPAKIIDEIAPIIILTGC